MVLVILFNFLNDSLREKQSEQYARSSLSYIAFSSVTLTFFLSWILNLNFF